ncbi:MAG TPA: recombinase family protein [Acidobacteriaceae bacterium]|jgi:DNA invertase Pin-like site-specific DNA recombinase
MANGKFVTYLRVSTARQGVSGLGLEAQRAAVQAHLNGGSWKIVSELVEVESGKRSDRPQLLKALKLCRLHGAVLLIAKLDRLSRNVAFLSNLMESGVQFTAADMPEADKTHLQMMMVFAEHEARAISARTKAALQAAKARGTALGGRRVSAKRFAEIGVTGREVSAEVRAEKARVRAQDRLEAIEDVRANGATSLREIAAALNERGIPTPTEKGEWSAVQVSRVLSYA